MSRGIKRALRVAIDNVNAEIRANARDGGMYARGLSGEGYAGGFRDALYAVQAVLNGVEPSDSRARQYFTAPPATDTARASSDGSNTI